MAAAALAWWGGRFAPAPSCDMNPRYADACRLLEAHFGFSTFRPMQSRIVQSVLAGRDVLGVLPTGGGKSVCFQVPAMVLGGLTLVVSPLIALMEDQVRAAKSRGLAAASLAGPLEPTEIATVFDRIARGEVRLLYTSPERLTRAADALAARGLRPALLAVDEAHCIAEWGHDFRPSYRALAAARERLGRPPVVALTGSATARVRDEIVAALGLGGPRRDCDIHLASFDRKNLWFGVRRVESERERLDALLGLLRDKSSLAIVYAPTRKSTEALASALRQAGHVAIAYHAGLDREARAARLLRFLAGDLGVVVATSAFGMGIDKPDVRLVVHWSMPPTPESYYQEAGRAGRDGGPARCVLLHRRGDAEIHRRQLAVTFPDHRLVEEVWNGQRPASRVPRAVAESIERLRAELKPERGRVDWRRVDLRKAAALGRIEAVERYARRRSCRRAGLLGYFGERIGRCAGCEACARRPPVLARVWDRLRG